MIGREIEEEVFKDFKESLKKIDFKHYRSSSPEFMTALMTGAMWRLIVKANKRDMDEWFDTSEPTMAVNAEIKTMKEEINDKLQASQDHYNRFVEIKDMLFHQMAIEELHHAELLIKKAGEKMTSGEYQQHIKCYEDWYRKLYDSLINNENGVK